MRPAAKTRARDVDPRAGPTFGAHCRPRPPLRVAGHAARLLARRCWLGRPFHPVTASRRNAHKGLLTMHSTVTGECIAEFTSPKVIWCCQLTADGKMLLEGGFDMQLRLYDAQKLALLQVRDRASTTLSLAACSAFDHRFRCPEGGAIASHSQSVVHTPLPHTNRFSHTLSSLGRQSRLSHVRAPPSFGPCARRETTITSPSAAGIARRTCSRSTAAGCCGVARPLS